MGEALKCPKCGSIQMIISAPEAGRLEDGSETDDQFDIDCAECDHSVAFISSFAKLTMMEYEKE